jgi:hypothetical protein
MKVLIQCAATKDPRAGCMRATDGRRVKFVAHPPPKGECGGDYTLAHPDDFSDNGQTWRACILTYNQNREVNPFGLLPAYRLYSHPAYRALADGLGVRNLFILSAGWGLIPADFLTPDYDITFSGSADAIKRRRTSDHFNDWSMIESNSSEPLLFLGGKAYFRLFCELTERYGGPRIALYNSTVAPPPWPGVEPVRYVTTTRTNWHYEGARALLDGKIDLSGYV